MRSLKIDNYIITTPLIEVITLLRLTITNGKLRDIKPWREGEDNIVVTCPNNNHSGGQESSPACNIYVGDNPDIEYGYFRCWVCNEQGSFVKFVAECFNSSEAYAKQWLISNFGALAVERIVIDDAIDLNKSRSFKINKPKTLDSNVLNTFQTWHPYLAQRKLSREVCELFNVRYDQKLRQIVFPCYDVKGNLIMMPRRSIDYKTFYLDRDIEKPVYCLDFIQKHNYSTAIITEGPFDVLTAYTYGYPAIGTFGNPSDYQIDQINKSCITVLYTMFDNDEAGRKFTRTLKNRLDKRILVVEVKLPDGKKDINDLDLEEFQNILKNAKNLN